MPARRDTCTAHLETLAEQGEEQQSQTAPDARLLRKSDQTVAGYNLQIAIDDKHKLIIEHEVTNAGNDSHQLEGMAKCSKACLGVAKLTVVANGGYDY